jgi:hypothetical protein
MACSSSWCYDRRMVDWWWIWRSVADNDWGCYWSVLAGGKGEWSLQLLQGFLCTKVAFSNLDNADGHFHIGDLHLACNYRSATKCVEICVHVMLVFAKDCSALSLHELCGFRYEFIVLPQS